MYEFKFKQKRNMLRVGEPVFKTEYITRRSNKKRRKKKKKILLNYYKIIFSTDVKFKISEGQQTGTMNK